MVFPVPIIPKLRKLKFVRPLEVVEHTKLFSGTPHDSLSALETSPINYYFHNFTKK
jgi:hypothetical protein